MNLSFVITFFLAAFVINVLLGSVAQANKKRKAARESAPLEKPDQKPVAARPNAPVQSRIAPRVQPSVAPQVRPQNAAPTPHRRHGTHSAGRPDAVPEGVSLEQMSLFSKGQPVVPPCPTEMPPSSTDAAYSLRKEDTAGEARARAELRRAMILKEVLDRPLSMRRGMRV